MLRYAERLKMLFSVESIWIRWYPRLALISTVVVFAAFVLVPSIPHAYPWP